jgi:hypothetical protein
LSVPAMTVLAVSITLNHDGFGVVELMLPSSLCCVCNTHHERTDVSCADGKITSRSILTDSLLPQ